MIKEARRESILNKLRAMRRNKTIYENSRLSFIEELKAANLESASHLELSKLVGISRQRITQLIQGLEDE